MSTVRHLLQRKGNTVYTVQPEDSLGRALQVLADNNIGALLVVDADHRPVGIFSERDFARKCGTRKQVDFNQPIRENMTGRLFTVTPETTMGECMRMMTDLHIRHLPVLENDRLVGMISIGDVVKEVISDHEFTIQHLENYITGRK